MKMYNKKKTCYIFTVSLKNIRNRATYIQQIIPIGTFKYADMKSIAVRRNFFSMNLTYMDTASLQKKKRKRK